jgi:large subunit ribosomal protein L35
MPKMKTDRGAAKRFKVTGTGRLKRGQAFHAGHTGKMSAKRKRHLRGETEVSRSDERMVRRLLGR